MNYNDIISLIIIVAFILITIYVSIKKEGFYTFYPPTNCMNDVFGTTKCFPPWSLWWYPTRNRYWSAYDPRGYPIVLPYQEFIWNNYDRQPFYSWL